MKGKDKNINMITMVIIIFTLIKSVIMYNSVPNYAYMVSGIQTTTTTLTQHKDFILPVKEIPYLLSGIVYTGKMTCSYWITPQVIAMAVFYLKVSWHLKTHFKNIWTSNTHNFNVVVNFLPVWNIILPISDGRMGG